MRNGKFMKIPKANLSAVSNARYNSCHVYNWFLVFCTSIQLTFNRRDTLDLREASRSKYNLSPDEIHLPPKGDPTSQTQSLKAQATFPAQCTQLTSSTPLWNEEKRKHLSGTYQVLLMFSPKLWRNMR